MQARLPVNADTEYPCARSAACLLARATLDTASRFELLLIGGDTGTACSRLGDIWVADSRPDIHGALPWQRLQTTGDPRLEPRSNHAAAVAGDKLVVFGGWDGYGTTPLAALRVLALSEGTWLDSNAVSGEPPAPRGQPCLAAATDGSAVFVHGGWDGAQRFGDLYALDMCQMKWLHVPTGVSPAARADHTCSVWHYCDDGVWKDLLVSFAGSTAAGPQNDVWLFDTRRREWTEAFCAGTPPAPRSSHAAAVAGDVLVVLGGQYRGHVFGDCHILDLVSLTWRQVEVPGLLPVCRHSIAFGGGVLWGFGGFDGSVTISRPFAIAMDTVVGRTGGAASAAPETEAADAASGTTGTPTASEGASGWLSGVERTLGFRPPPPLSPRPLHTISGGQQPGGGRGAGQDAPDEEPSGGPPAMLAHRPEEHGQSQLAEPLTSLRISPLAATETSDGFSRKHNGNLAEPGAPPDTPGSGSAKSDQGITPGGSAEAASLAGPQKPAAFSLADLDPRDRLLKGWRLTKVLHEAAVAAERDTYIDPPTGYTVFTARYLGRRPCCGNKCSGDGEPVFGPGFTARHHARSHKGAAAAGSASQFSVLAHLIKLPIDSTRAPDKSLDCMQTFLLCSRGKTRP